MDANIDKLKRSIDDGVMSGQITTSAAIKMTELMYTMVEACKAMNVQNIISMDERAESNINGQTSQENSEGVSLAEHDYSWTAKRNELVDKTKPHLIALCSLCNKIAVIEYSGLHLPKYTAAYVEIHKNGMAYATCTICQRTNKSARQGKKAFDWARLDDFLSSNSDADVTRRTNLRKAAKPYLGNGLKTLKIRNKPAYLTADLLERSLVEGHEIFNLHLFTDDQGKPQVGMTEHISGDFFRF